MENGSSFRSHSRRSLRSSIRIHSSDRRIIGSDFERPPKSTASLRCFSRVTTLLVAAPEVHARHESRAEDYLHKSVLLKQIMSNKARRYRAINAAQNIATVVVSSLLLFIGFSGLDKLTVYVSWFHPTGREVTEFGFNILVFFLFVIGILHLVFRFSEKQSAADKSISSLAALGNEIEDIITGKGNLIISEESPRELDLIRTRYEAIAESSPPNSDREFFRAKRDLASKTSRKPTLSVDPRQLFRLERTGENCILYCSRLANYRRCPDCSARNEPNIVFRRRVDSQCGVGLFTRLYVSNSGG